jgi:hypothetical protein
MNKYRIENWSVVVNPLADVYTPPEFLSQHLNGAVANHPKFGNCDNVTTSAIVGFKDGCIEVASGKFYELGEVSSIYEAKFPNAKRRLLASFDKNGKIHERT